MDESRPEYTPVRALIEAAKHQPRVCYFGATDQILKLLIAIAEQQQDQLDAIQAQLARVRRRRKL